MVAMLIAAHLLASPVPSDRGCEPLPAPLRVRMTIGSDDWQDALPVMRAIVEETWSPAGLRIDWALPARRWDDIDLWISAIHGMKVTAEGGGLGIVSFHGNRPRPLARVSIDAALIWMRRHQAQLLKTPVHVIRGPADDRGLVHRVLGYAAAHELGHFVLATKTHAPTGVMQAVYRSPDLMFDPQPWRLDDRSQGQLRRRLSNCAVAAP